VREIFTKETLLKIIFIDILFTVSTIFFFESLKPAGSLSIVSVINQTQTILTVIIATLIFNEEKKDFLRKLVSFVVVILGVVTVASP